MVWVLCVQNLIQKTPRSPEIDYFVFLVKTGKKRKSPGVCQHPHPKNSKFHYEIENFSEGGTRPDE